MCLTVYAPEKGGTFDRSDQLWQKYITPLFTMRASFFLISGKLERTKEPELPLDLDFFFTHD